jgi:alpha-glucosidase
LAALPGRGSCTAANTIRNFLPTQPDLNFRNDGVRSAILETARFWLDRGVDGFRLDVANYYVHDAKPGQSASGDPNWRCRATCRSTSTTQPAGDADFIARLRELLDGRVRQ